MTNFPEVTFDFFPQDLEKFVALRNPDPFQSDQETINSFWHDVIEHLRDIVRQNRDQIWAGVMHIHENTIQVSYGMNRRQEGGTWDPGIDAALQKEVGVIASKGWKGIDVTHTYAAQNIEQLKAFNTIQLDFLLDERRELMEAGLISPAAASQSHHAGPQPVQTEDSATPVPSALPVPQSGASVRLWESSADRDGGYDAVPVSVHLPQYRESPSEWSAV